MFMRLMTPEEGKVELLLLDEPSAALDPVAEHGTPTPFRSSSLSLFAPARFVYAASRAEGREDDDFLVPSVWTSHETC